jgi:hypothetical protein
MNRRIATTIALFCAAASVSQAQEKEPAKPKAPLIFNPGEKLPGAADPGAKGAVVQSGVHGNPLADGPSQIVATFFQALKDNKVDDGYATLTKGSKIAEKPEELRNLKAKTREAISVFGEINGYDFVESKAIGQRLIRATYVSLGKVFPLRWRFYFYKPEDVWRLIDMRVDDKLPGIFDEPEDVKAAATAADALSQ